MPKSRILVWQKRGKGYIKIEGEGTFRNAGMLKAAYQEMLKHGVIDFVIDLSACELVDSTHLGILLGLCLKVKERGSVPVRVLQANDFIKALLRDLGIDRLVIHSGPETESKCE